MRGKEDRIKNGNIHFIFIHLFIIVNKLFISTTLREY